MTRQLFASIEIERCPPYRVVCFVRVDCACIIGIVVGFLCDTSQCFMRNQDMVEGPIAFSMTS